MDKFEENLTYHGIYFLLNARKSITQRVNWFSYFLVNYWSHILMLHLLHRNYNLPFSALLINRGKPKTRYNLTY
jgi:hypothetical protein